MAPEQWLADMILTTLHQIQNGQAQYQNLRRVMMTYDKWFHEESGWGETLVSEYWLGHAAWDAQQSRIDELEGELGEVVLDILKLEAAQKLCAIYFNIAADAIGEDKVRELRDQIIEDTTNE